MDNREMLTPGVSETRPSRKETWGAWASTGFGLAIIAEFFFISILVVGISSAIYSFYLASHESFALSLGQFLESREGLLSAITEIPVAIISVILIAAFIRLRKGLSFSDYLGLKRFHVKQLLLWLGIIVVVLVLSEVLRSVLQRPPNESQLHLYATAVWPPLLWVSIIIFAPVFEEALFRGFLFEGFRRSPVGPVVTVILMSAVWTSLHVPADYFDLLTIFAGGIVLGTARIKTNSLWVPFSLHVFWNLVATVEIIVLGTGS
jgi:uncharacterized protein